jgi:signal peptidase I
MNETRRGAPARVGIAALNLWAPGLGLLRTGPLRRAIVMLLLGPAGLLFLLAFFALSPTLDFEGYAAGVLFLLIGGLALLSASVVQTWRRSRDRPASLPRWSRSYAVLGAALAVWLLSLGLSQALRSHYRVFYLPSEAMSPTLEKNDRIVAAMKKVGPLRSGDIILFDVRDSVYIKRIAALPGDRIAMRDGIVILNGRPVPQRFLREEPVATKSAAGRARRLAERFRARRRSTRSTTSNVRRSTTWPSAKSRRASPLFLGITATDPPTAGCPGPTWGPTSYRSPTSKDGRFSIIGLGPSWGAR